MKITIIQVGKTKTSYFQESEAEYIKRLHPYAHISIITVKESKITQKAKDQEAQHILAQIPTKTLIIALDETGKQFTSPNFATFLTEIRDQKGANITFIIGGAFGLSPAIKQKAHTTIALSTMTFTHEMVRTILLEQLYRAFTIIQGKTYHY